MIINSKTYKIGTDLGSYQSGKTLTDSLIGLSTISSIGYGDQIYNYGFNQIKELSYIDFSSLFTTTDNTYLTIYFENPICLK